MKTNSAGTKLELGYAMAERFLTLLDEESEEFTFQTFDDSGKKRQALTKVLNGTLAAHWNLLVELNGKGAGVFVTINRTDLKGRKVENIIGIRAVFKEDDRGGTPELPLAPQIIVESSPGKRHEYVLTDSEYADEFSAVQHRIVDDYGSDPNAKDLVRVLRLPGFYHLKNPEKPHLVKIIHESGVQPYSWETVKKAFPPVERLKVNFEQFPPGRFAKQELESALSVLNPDCEYSDWIKVGMAIHYASSGSIEGYQLWDKWSAKGDLYPNCKETAYKWASFGKYKETQITQKGLFELAYKSGWKGLNFTRDEILQMLEETELDDIDRIMEINGFIKKSKLSKVDSGYLYKQIKKKFNLNIGDLKADNKDDIESIDEVQIAEETLQMIGADNLIYTQSWFYSWDVKGVWRVDDELFIKKSIHTLCKTKDYDYTAHKVDAVLKLLTTETYKRDHQFDNEYCSINCGSGELHFVEGKWNLKVHNKKAYRITQIPIKYDPNAKAERFIRFLKEVFSGDVDADEKIVMVLEAIGYSLLNTCKFEKFFLLIGSGANGKSVLLSVIEALLGRTNVTAVQPSNFDNRFQRAHLHGKLANIVTEIKEGAEIEDAQLKSIVSGELTTAEHKNKDPFDFHPFCTCWFGTNHMPHTRDFSDALFRRAIILQFNNKFEGDNCDPNLKDKLLDELPGIFVLSLNAIASVLERGQFTNCQSNREAKELWKLEADQVRQFIDEHCELATHAIITISELYGEYQVWADESGIKRRLNKKNFGSRLDRLGIKKEKKKTGWFRCGLKIKLSATYDNQKTGWAA